MWAWLLMLAIWIGKYFKFENEKGLAFLSKRVFTIYSLPNSQAWCKGVQPLLSEISTFAPHFKIKSSNFYSFDVCA